LVEDGGGHYSQTNHMGCSDGDDDIEVFSIYLAEKDLINI
jgi:hypothetical protein